MLSKKFFYCCFRSAIENRRYIKIRNDRVFHNQVLSILKYVSKEVHHGDAVDTLMTGIFDNKERPWQLGQVLSRQHLAKVSGISPRERHPIIRWSLHCLQVVRPDMTVDAVSPHVIREPKRTPAGVGPNLEDGSRFLVP